MFKKWIAWRFFWNEPKKVIHSVTGQAILNDSDSHCTLVISNPSVSKPINSHFQMYGTGPEIIYAYTGGSSDWAKESARIKYTYTIELRPGFYGLFFFKFSTQKLTSFSKALIFSMEWICSRQKPADSDGAWNLRWNSSHHGCGRSQFCRRRKVTRRWSSQHW